MPRRTTHAAAALLAATQCAAFTAPITMGLKPLVRGGGVWRRAGTAAAGAAVGLLTPLKAGARALVSNEVIKAAAEPAPRASRIDPRPHHHGPHHAAHDDAADVGARALQGHLELGGGHARL